MTREETLAMRAGIELDCLVTRELFPYDGYHEYSTNISAAWQVVGKMRSDENLLWEFSLALSNMSLAQDSRMIKTDHIADLMRWLCPEAICKAALLAKLEVGNVS